MSGTQRRMTADERERLTRLRVEQASQELAAGLMDYADWLLAEIRQPMPQGRRIGSIKVKEILEQALAHYAMAAGS